LDYVVDPVPRGSVKDARFTGLCEIGSVKYMMLGAVVDQSDLAILFFHFGALVDALEGTTTHVKLYQFFTYTD